LAKSKSSPVAAQSPENREAPPSDPRRLRPDVLRWRCDVGHIAQHRNAPHEDNNLIGQTRAIEALRLGLTLESPGANIFVCGPSGTGKMSTVRAMLKQRPQRQKPLWDYAYVHNFADPDRPRLLRTPAGTARALRKEFEAIVVDLPETISRVLDAEHVERRREKLTESFKDMERGLLSNFDRACAEAGFQLAQVQVGEASHLEIYVIHRKKPTDIDELRELVATGKARVPNMDALEAKHESLRADLRATLAQLRREARRMQQEVNEFEVSAVRESLEDVFGDFQAQFPYDGVEPWLGEVTAALLDHLDLFGESDEPNGPENPASREQQEQLIELIRRLRINIVLDNDGVKGTPVVFENFPTFTNLLGTVERPSEDSRGNVDYTHIKAGSLLRADGGYLIVNATDAVTEAGVWRGLTRVLKTRELEIQSPEQFMTPGGTNALKPESIRVDVKVIAVGDDDLYRMLYTGTDEFRRVFKIKADFDDEMPRDDRHIGLYCHHAWRVAEEEKMRPISDAALAALVEYGVRLADRRDRLSARFSDVTDVLREAAHYAQAAQRDAVEVEDVQRTMVERKRRHGLAEERLHGLIHCGLVDVSTAGKAVGAINALTVLDLADHAFGQPCRISASVSPGHDGLISIEREVELSGRLHDKGTLILTAYLRTHYLPSQPLSLSATLTFEQLHEELDGDSASAAEALALLSALAEVPIPQGLAITGAIDQRGRILAIGGVNEKIEGFFRLCEQRGLDGTQGVMIPSDNRLNLQLDPDVVRAVDQGRFHIWAVRHLDEAIDLLTGEPAGALDPRGRFPGGSFNSLVRQRLIDLARLSGQGKPGRPARRPVSRRRDLDGGDGG